VIEHQLAVKSVISVDRRGERLPAPQTVTKQSCYRAGERGLHQAGRPLQGCRAMVICRRVNVRLFTRSLPRLRPTYIKKRASERVIMLT